MSEQKMKFDNKVVWVSGAAQGIGRGIAEYFANAGAQVALVDVNCKEGELLEKELNSAATGTSKFIYCDLHNEKEIEQSILQTVAHFGDLHILINNAGVNIVKFLHEYSSEEWDWQLAVNLKAPFLSFKYAYDFLKKHEASYVVNIGSVNSFIGQARTPGYSASKSGLNILTKSIAIDYAVDGIRCNLVCPGVTDTPMLRTHMVNESRLQKRLGRIPMGRLLAPDEIAKAVAYLSCEDSSGITGTSIVIDGGYLATAEWEGGVDL